MLEKKIESGMPSSLLPTQTLSFAIISLVSVLSLSDSGNETWRQAGRVWLIRKINAEVVHSGG